MIRLSIGLIEIALFVFDADILTPLPSSFCVTCHLGCLVDDCRNKWKNLRDTFVKFKRAEQQRRASGELDIHKKTWMHSRSMSFLTPFIQPKGLQGDTTDDLEEERERNRESATEGVDDKSAYIIHEIEGGQADDEDASSPDTVSGSNGPSRKRRWQMDGMDGLEDIEDEMFFFSLLPYLRKLPHRKKSAVKLKIHQLLHEAAFQ